MEEQVVVVVAPVASSLPGVALDADVVAGEVDVLCNSKRIYVYTRLLLVTGDRSGVRSATLYRYTPYNYIMISKHKIYAGKPVQVIIQHGRHIAVFNVDIQEIKRQGFGRSFSFPFYM